MTHFDSAESKWKSIYRLGGWSALGAVLVGILEIAITFLPGGNVPYETVLDWLNLFQDNWFMGLRNLGLLNIFLNTFGIFTFFALFAAHRKVNQPFATLAILIAFLGIGVFYATNRAFPMLDLSNQYAIATTEAQRATLEAAGQTMLSVGQSHTPGTFLGFFLLELAGILMSIVMLRGGRFGNVSAYAGICGFSILLVFEFFSSFVSGLNTVTMLLAMFGGILSMLWYILIAGKFFRIAKDAVPDPRPDA
jgi:hypothetical protein